MRVREFVEDNLLVGVILASLIAVFAFGAWVRLTEKPTTLCGPGKKPETKFVSERSINGEEVGKLLIFCVER